MRSLSIYNYLYYLEEEDDESLHSKEDIETKDEREEETIGLIRKHEDGEFLIIDSFL